MGGAIELRPRPVNPCSADHTGGLQVCAAFAYLSDLSAAVRVRVPSNRAAVPGQKRLEYRRYWARDAYGVPARNVYTNSTTLSVAHCKGNGCHEIQ